MITQRIILPKVEAPEPISSPRHPGRFQVSCRSRFKIKLLVSCLLIGSLIVFGRMDLSQSLRAALQADRYFLIAALLLLLASVVPQARRWQLLASAVGFDRKLLRLVQYNYVGLFFNLFLPSTVGGDASRCYYLCRGTGRYSSALLSVLVDRSLGISILFAMATLGLLVGPGGEALPWQLKVPVFAGTVCLFGIIPLAPRFIVSLLGEYHWISRRFLDSSARIYWTDRKLMLSCLAWSLAAQILVIGVHIAIGLALGLKQIPLWYYFVFYPCVTVIGFVTPSVNGIGVREWAYTYFLTLAGVDSARALTYAIMWLGFITLLSLVGGLVYIAGHMKISGNEVERIRSESLK